MITTILFFFVLNFIYDYYDDNINNKKQKIQLWLFGMFICLLFIMSCKTETKPVTPVVKKNLLNMSTRFNNTLLIAVRLCLSTPKFCSASKFNVSSVLTEVGSGS